MYERDNYTLYRFELVAPAVRNDGSISHYAEAIRAQLSSLGFTGWTEIQTTGYWCGKLETGTTFVLYAEDTNDETAHIIGHAARNAMPDQEAIQVVKFPEPVTLYEK